MMSACLFRRPSRSHGRRIALAALLLSGIAGAGTGLGTAALAAPPHAGPQVVMDAEDLDLSVPCLGRFEIMVDPAMSDGVSIDSSPSGGAHLTMRTGKTQGSSKVLITSRTCAPNARVSILVAPNVGVLIHDSHDTHIVIHGTLASLEASLEAGQLDADTVQSLDLSLRGTEQVHIANLNRAAQVVETGASGLVVDHADLDAFSAQLSETSHLTVTDGRFDVLTLMVENAASARLGGSANTATVSANGTGLVAIPTVSGALTRTGNVQVGPVAATPAPSPSAPATPGAAAGPSASAGAMSPSATSQGTTSQGATSQGALSQNAATENAASQGTVGATAASRTGSATAAPPATTAGTPSASGNAQTSAAPAGTGQPAQSSSPQATLPQETRPQSTAPSISGAASVPPIPPIPPATDPSQTAQPITRPAMPDAPSAPSSSSKTDVGNGSAPVAPADGQTSVGRAPQGSPATGTSASSSPSTTPSTPPAGSTAMPSVKGDQPR